MIVHKEITIGRSTLVLEAGRVAKQADGAVLASLGDSVVLATACIDTQPREVDFIPLVVDYRERKSAGGKIPGGFFKREGRPSTSEILVCRLIDRSIRPQLPKSLNRETQIVGTAFSADPEHATDVVAMNGAFAALALSNIPHEHVLGAVRVGRVDGELVFNPSAQELEKSQMDIVVSGTSGALVMVEGQASQVPEEVLAEALEAAHAEIKKIIAAIKQMAAEAGKPKLVFEEDETDTEIETLVRETVGRKLFSAMTGAADKLARKAAVKEIEEAVLTELEERWKDAEDQAHRLNQARRTLRELEREVVRGRVVTEGLRVDGRKPDQVRPITIETSFLPRTHGSTLFTRGETQAMVTVTLGTVSDEQKIETLTEEYWSHFLLHYNFPPYSVGEVRFLRGPGRREIGHGVLAERALTAVLPNKDDFPYTIRVVSDITESNGSSSMATVCGGSLALMDAGVPVKAAVAGVAMGLIKEGDDYTILTDILGDEDHVGDMDFKVAGTRNGVTALQMDIKLDGLPTDVLKRALEQARRGRVHILDLMDEVLPVHRAELSPYAPRIQTLDIPTDKIRDLIGPGGKIIRGIIEQTGVSIDVEDDGHVTVASADLDALERAMKIIRGIVTDPEPGEVYTGKVTRIMNFGAFVEIAPGKEGLVHISELEWGRVGKVEDVCKVGDEMTVKVTEIDSQGRLNLSRRLLLEKPEGYEERRRDNENRGSDRGGRGRRDRRPKRNR
jgi:polyribonucleotide nucleotidyltransferase